MDSSFVKVGAIVATIVFYIPFLMIMTKSFGPKRGRQHFYRSIKNIFERESDDSKCIDQISIVYKSVFDNNQEFSKKYPTLINICEDLLTRASGYTGFSFKFHYSLSFSPEEVNRLSSIIKSIENDMPFISLSSKYGNQLDMLKLAFDSNDLSMGVNGLNQLAKDIKYLETTIEIQNRRNRIATWVSVTGIILTVIFGAVSIFQIYAPS